MIQTVVYINIKQYDRTFWAQIHYSKILQNLLYLEEILRALYHAWFYIYTVNPNNPPTVDFRQGRGKSGMKRQI